MHAIPHVVNAIIGWSVAYRTFDNLGEFRTIFGFYINPRYAVPLFGLFDGFGLVIKLQELSPNGAGLLLNLLSSNNVVELSWL